MINESDESKLKKLSIKEICVSEEIKSILAPIIIEYLNNKKSLIDALDWIRVVIENDKKNGLECYRNACGATSKKKIDIDSNRFNITDPEHYFKPEMKMIEGDESFEIYICRVCATKMGAVPPKDHRCIWVIGNCDFCYEKSNVCEASSWNWPDYPNTELI